MKRKITTDIIDGKEVIVESVIKDLDYRTIADELRRIESEIGHLLYRAEALKAEYDNLQKSKEFYENEMKKFSNAEESILGDDIFNIE